MRKWVRIFVALAFVWVGIHHFIDPNLYMAIMPAYLPWHMELVLLSGLFEVFGGVGLLWPRFRKAAGWGLLALLIAVYPANINMLVNEVYLPGMPKEKWLLWARMPFQLVFAFAVAWTSGIWPRTKTVEVDEAPN